MERGAAAVSLGCLLLCACAVTKVAPVERGGRDVGIDRSGLPQPVTTVKGVSTRLFRDGPVLIGGQPDPEAIAALAGMGVTADVNLRTPAENADREEVPFDEKAEATRLGMAYVNIPVGAGHPYSPQTLERFAEVLGQRRGLVFVHCGVGVRAAWVWTAYLIRDGGLSLEAALARGRVIGISADPLELMLSRPIRRVWAAQPLVAPSPSPAPH